MNAGSFGSVSARYCTSLTKFADPKRISEFTGAEGVDGEKFDGKSALSAMEAELSRTW